MPVTVDIYTMKRLKFLSAGGDLPMKTILFILLFTGTSAIAADIVEFKNGVVFNHLSHKTDKAGLCSACHEGEPGKIPGFGKEWAHKNCIECHDIFEKGPTKCDGCHTRKK